MRQDLKTERIPVSELTVRLVEAGLKGWCPVKSNLEESADGHFAVVVFKKVRIKVKVPSKETDK